MAKKKKQESVTVLMMGCGDAVSSVLNGGIGDEFTGTLLHSTLNESLKALEEGELDYTSADPVAPENECDAIYEVTIKKLGAIGSAVHLIK